MVGASYCTQCGARLSEEGRFCPSCGSPVSGAPASENADEGSSGLLGKIGAGLATIVAIPLAIIMSLLGLVLPFLFIAALVWGPSETWDKVQAWIPGGAREADAAGCEGFEDWLRASNERGAEVLKLTEPVTRREVEDPVALRATSNDVRELLRDQEESNPPPEAEVLNGHIVELYKIQAKFLIAIAEGDASEVTRLQNEMERLLPLADDEDKRVRQACL